MGNMGVRAQRGEVEVLTGQVLLKGFGQSLQVEGEGGGKLRPLGPWPRPLGF